MELESNGTNINLEILSKAIATRYKIKEVPAVLEGRELGHSKLKFRSKTISHVLFSLYEKPMILFGAIGFFLLLIGLISGIYLFYEYINRYIRSYSAFDDIHGVDDNFRNTNIDLWICSNTDKPFET